MAAVVGKYAAKKMLNGKMSKYQNENTLGGNDPFWTEITVKGKTKKVKKPIPEYLTGKDRKIFVKVRNRAFLFDSRFNFFGITRFGLSSVIGLIPGAGDIVGTVMSIWIVRTCNKIDGGLPKTLQSRMWTNVLIDLIIGLVPLLGDIADTFFKSNKMNVALLEEYLAKKYAAACDLKQAEMAFLAGTDGAYGPPRQHYHATEPRMPERTRVPQDRREGQGWFNGRNGRERHPDLEPGPVRVEQVRQDTRRSRR